MATSPVRRGNLVPMVLVALLVALPGVLAEVRVAPPAASPSPALDRFLAAVQRVTPASAHILVAGAPPALAFYRATALLYPREVYSAFPTDYAHAQTAAPTGWPALQRLAHRDGARFVVLWNVQVQVGARAVVLAREGAGLVVEAQP